MPSVLSTIGDLIAVGLPGVGSLAALISGRATPSLNDGRTRPDVATLARLPRATRLTAAGISFAAVWAVVAFVVQRATGVSVGQVLGAALPAAFILVALPGLAYYALGYRFSDRDWPYLVWLIGLVPLYICVAFAAFVMSGAVGCPPNAYECPV